MYNNAHIIIIISMLWNGEVNSVLCVFPDPEASCWKEEKRSNKPKSGWTEEFAAETYVRSSEFCLKKKKTWTLSVWNYLRLIIICGCLNPQRLQNPKIEKAEILDLAVEYLQRWTEEGKPENGINTLK